MWKTVRFSVLLLFCILVVEITPRNKCSHNTCCERKYENRQSADKNEKREIILCPDFLFRDQTRQKSVSYVIQNDFDLRESFEGLCLDQKLVIHGKSFFTHGKAIALASNQTIRVPKYCVVLNTSKDSILSKNGLYIPSNITNIFVASCISKKISYTLNGIIQLPDSCELIFKGGNLKNGTLILGENNSIISGKFHSVSIIANNNCTITNTEMGGSINNNSSYKNAYISISNKHGVKIQNCDLYKGYHGIVALNSSNLDILNNKIHNFKIWGLYYRKCKNVIIKGNECCDMADGIKGAIGTENVTISDNCCHNNSQDGIDVAGLDFKDLYIVNNRIYDNKFNGIEVKTLNRENYPLNKWGYSLQDVRFKNVQICHNNIRNVGVSGISCFYNYGNTDSNYLENVRISSNIIHAAIGTSVIGICKEKNQFIIDSNIIHETYPNGSQMVNCTNVVYKNNTVYGTNAGLRVMCQPEAYGDVIRPSGNVISNNHIKTPKNRLGIWFVSCMDEDNVLHNNTVTGKIKND